MTDQEDDHEGWGESGNTGEIEATEQPLTPLQCHYISRLAHLTDLRASHKTDPDFEAWLMYAINKAILATVNALRFEGQ